MDGRSAVQKRRQLESGLGCHKIIECLAEDNIHPPALGVMWDSPCLANTNPHWKGEFLLIDDTHFIRSCAIKPFRLLHNSEGQLSPRLTAIGVLYEVYGDDLFKMYQLAPLLGLSADDKDLLHHAIRPDSSTQLTSSVLHLFDAVASLLNLAQGPQHMGDGLRLLETIAASDPTTQHYKVALRHPDTDLFVNWTPSINQILGDLYFYNTHTSRIASKFHNTLAQIILAVAQHIGEEVIVLSGQAFQNRVLAERSAALLQKHGYTVVDHMMLQAALQTPNN